MKNLITFDQSFVFCFFSKYEIGTKAQATIQSVTEALHSYLEPQRKQSYDK